MKRREGGGAGGGVQPLQVFVRELVAAHVGAVGVARVLDLAVQAQAVPALGAVGAEVAGEGPLARVHAHVLHQLVGGARQVTAAVAAVLVALAMTLEVHQQLLLPRKRPLADAAAVRLRGAGGPRTGCHGN